MKDSRQPVPHFLRVVRALANVRSTLPVAAVVTTTVAFSNVNCSDGVAVCHGFCVQTTGTGGTGTGTGTGGHGGQGGSFSASAGFFPMMDSGPDGPYDGGPVGDMVMPDGGHDGG